VRWPQAVTTGAPMMVGPVVQGWQRVVEVSLAGSFTLDVLAQLLDARPGNHPGAAARLVVAVRSADHPAQPGPPQVGHQVSAVARIPPGGPRRPLPRPGDRRERLLRGLGIEPQAISVFQEEPAASPQRRGQLARRGRGFP
jgi:hypothetical protein